MCGLGLWRVSRRLRFSIGLRGRAIHWLVTRTPLDRNIFERTSRMQYLIFQFFAITILAGLPVKMILRLVFRIQYVVVTPWFNI